MQIASNWAQRLEIFFGAASEAMCRVYARLEYAAGEDEMTLTGTLSGPTCLYAETLGAVFSFADRGRAPSLLAEAVVPEPCFWTPALPHVYRARIALRRAGAVVAEVERTFGIRPLGAAGRQLRYAGKAWVLRGVSAPELGSVDLTDWHAAGTALLVAGPNDALCAEASRVGVLIVADLPAPDIGEIRRVSRWPAVGVVAFPGSQVPDVRGLGYNAILAQRFGPAGPVLPAPWAGAAICELHDSERLPDGFVDCPIPLIALRRAGPLAGVGVGRAACDQLQRELAPHGQFAGYIV